MQKNAKFVQKKTLKGTKSGTGKSFNCRGMSKFGLVEGIADTVPIMSRAKSYSRAIISCQKKGGFQDDVVAIAGDFSNALCTVKGKSTKKGSRSRNVYIQDPLAKINTVKQIQTILQGTEPKKITVHGRNKRGLIVSMNKQAYLLKSDVIIFEFEK